MLQRLFALTALLVSAATLASATEVHVHVHHKHHKSHRARAAAGSSSGSSSSSVYAFSPVTSIQARVQGNTPTWDATTKTWVASFGDSYDEKFRSVLDTVNTASVEGALMYVQAEGINVNEQSVKCERKNKMQYVVFYEMTFVQPNASIAYYGGKDTTSTLEYCPYVAMDGGRCTPSGDSFPDTCKQYDGIDGQPKLGHCVGAGEQDTDKRAPYPGNYWFSYPNSCVTKVWNSKTDDCRKQYPGGLCAPGVTPDGISCSFTYKILGYLNLDDLVGITDGSWKDGGKKYSNYTEFCNDGNVEFAAKNTGNGFEVEQSIAFWEKPGDESANEDRADTMVELYNKLAPDYKTGGAKMEALPEIKDLVKANPPCYKNNKDCASASNGCRRKLYSQICEVCTKADDDCVKAPSGYKFPTLEVPKAVKSSSSQSGSGSGKNGQDVGDDKKSAAVVSAFASAAAVAVGLVAVAML